MENKPTAQTQKVFVIGWWKNGGVIAYIRLAYIHCVSKKWPTLFCT